LQLWKTQSLAALVHSAASSREYSVHEQTSAGFDW
jgi:hypothetical protein